MTTDIKESISPVDSAGVMGLLPSRPRLLALGEPTHREGALLDLRNELFRQLVEQEGYRTIALESDCLRGLLVDDYVTTGKGKLDEVMERGFGHKWGELEANRELVRWMRTYNEGRTAADQVRFAGADGPLEISGAESPRQALTALHGYLSDRVGTSLLPCTAEVLDSLIGPDDRWTDPAAMMDPARSMGQSAEAPRHRTSSGPPVRARGDLPRPSATPESRSEATQGAAGHSPYARTGRSSGTFPPQPGGAT